MGDRQILDGILIANELIDSRKRMQRAGVLLKVNLERHTIMLIEVVRTICCFG